MITLTDRPMGLFRVEFGELYARHLCRHSQFGINVAHHPLEAAWPATSLVAQGASTDAEQTLARVLASWDAWYRRWQAEGFAAIRAAWLERAFALGQTIELKQDRGARQGRFLGLDSSGALVLETLAGQRETHHFGDVVAARE